MNAGSCGILMVPRTTKHEELDKLVKDNKLTIVCTVWNQELEYRVFATGSLFSRNEEYPRGLVLIDAKGNPKPWTKNHEQPT